MVRKNYKWNISKEKGEKIVNETIRNFLKDTRDLMIDYDELIFILNNRTKDITIKNNNKTKTITNFIQNVLGGLIFYVENSRDFMIYKEDDKIYIRFLHNITSNDWIIVDEDSY